MEVVVSSLLIFSVESCNFYAVPKFTTKSIVNGKYWSYFVIDIPYYKKFVRIERDSLMCCLCNIYLRTSQDAEVNIKKYHLVKHVSVKGTVILSCNCTQGKKYNFSRNRWHYHCPNCTECFVKWRIIKHVRTSSKYISIKFNLTSKMTNP